MPDKTDDDTAPVRLSKRNLLKGVPMNKLLEKVLALKQESTPEEITLACRVTLHEAVKWHWSEIKNEPLEMFRKGLNHPKMKNCAKCTIPKVLHTDPTIECVIKDVLEADIQLELEMSISKIPCADLLWETILEKDPPKEEKEMAQDHQPNQFMHEPKRTALPQFSKKKFAHWSENVLAWNERYGASHPLDKFFDLVHALEKSDEGKDMSDKLMLENLNKNAANIIEICLNKLSEYLNVNSVTKANEVIQDWSNFKRETSEDMKEYIERFEHLRMRREDAKLTMSNNSYAWELMHRAGLNAQTLTLVQGRVEFDSDTVLKDMISALSLVVTTPTTSAFYQERGRNQYRNNSAYRNRSSSRKFCNCRIRCKCPDCTEHDDNMEKYGRPRSNSANRNGSQQRKKSSERASWANAPTSNNNTGTCVYTFNTFYYNGKEKMAYIDTGCQPILMSKKDLPHLEKLLGRKPTKTNSQYPVKFGDGNDQVTTECIIVPFWNGEEVVDHEVGVCDGDIPLLLGLQYLRCGCEAVQLEGGLRFKSGESLKYNGSTDRHLLLKWNKELHFGPQQEKKVDDKYVILDDFNQIETNVFYTEDDIIDSSSSFTNRQDYLLDNESTDLLQNFIPLKREGHYNDDETDRVYLFRNNWLDKLTVTDPFEYSDISQGILTNPHDRGISNGEDLEEKVGRKNKKKKKYNVKFNPDSQLVEFDRFEPPTKKITPCLVDTNDNLNSYYEKLSRREVEFPPP